TGFRRTTQPIFALAVCEGMRHIGFPDQFWRKPLAEQVRLAQQRVREHMQETNGQVGIWGMARQYWFYYAPGERVEISTNGDILREGKGTPPSQASLGKGLEKVLCKQST